MSLDSFLKRHENAQDIESKQKIAIFEEITHWLRYKDFSIWSEGSDFISFTHTSYPIQLQFTFDKRIDLFLDVELDHKPLGYVRFQKNSNGVSIFSAKEDHHELSVSSVLDAIDVLFRGL